jgi:glutathione peroxidase
MDKNGHVVNAYASSTKPTNPEFIQTIENTLKL